MKALLLIIAFIAHLLLPTPSRAERNMLKAYPVTPITYDLCPNGCMLFMDNEKETCDKCKSARFGDPDRNGRRKCLSSTIYLPLRDQLALILARPETRNKLIRLSELPDREDDSPMKDIFDGEAWNSEQKFLFNDPYDLALCVFVDGFKPFKRTSISLTLVHVIVMNFPPRERYITNTLRIRV